MDRLNLFFVTILFISWGSLAADNSIRNGVYALKGSNPGGMKKYDGRIVIQSEGTNYRVSWFIGPKQSQAQSGIGILENNVLSIGYIDNTGKDFGVVSLVVSGKTLSGKWASLFSRGDFGTEVFTFESESVPPELTPQAVKKSKDSTI